MIVLRDSQKKILEYRHGLMGVSAVPGSGKTWTLSLLAANLIAEGYLQEDQEVLIVTLVNSAVDNFYERIRNFIRQRNLLNLGYRVRTLHSLAHDIVRGRPDLLGLDEKFQIIDERESNAIRDEVARTWLQTGGYQATAELQRHPIFILDEYLNPDLDDSKLKWVKDDQLPRLAVEIATSFIRYAKDCQLTPEKLRQRLDALPIPLRLAEMGWSMYADYQRALNYRGAVDFDDLIRLALQALQMEPAYCERLRQQWPYILEDEAQDSNRLQEEILKVLAGEQGNWVRVGDPNQAIFETFTTANPKYLRDFIRREDVISMELPESGRSTTSIITLANYLLQWTKERHPVEPVRDALQAPPYIQQTRLDDPEPNPQDDPTQVHLILRKFSAAGEIKAVADSLERWLPGHSDATVAVLVPRNKRGYDLGEELNRRKIKYVDSLLQSTSSTRHFTGVLRDVLEALYDTQSVTRLAKAYQAWRRADIEDQELKRQVTLAAELLRKVGTVEDYLWPASGRNWLEELAHSRWLAGEDGGLNSKIDQQIIESLTNFREILQRWQAAVLLPFDQIILTIAQDLFSEPAGLALVHKLSLLMRQLSQAHPSWRLPELTEELAVIARNERRFIGFSQDDTGFDPNRYKGIVVLSTLHKAKGLEWDRVYLMSVNNYDFPSSLPGDDFISEKWYLRDKLNLEAEALAELEAALTSDEYRWYEEGAASSKARLDYVRERLRLLYVGITRAKKELVITWNTGRRADRGPELVPALPLVELNNYWQEYSPRALEKIPKTSQGSA